MLKCQKSNTERRGTNHLNPQGHKQTPKDEWRPSKKASVVRNSATEVVWSRRDSQKTVEHFDQFCLYLVHLITNRSQSL